MMDKGRLHKKNIRWASGNYKHRKHATKSIVATSPDFSDVEDAVTAYKTINEITSRAGRRAAAKRKRSGLSGIFIRNNQLIAVSPKGIEKIVSIKPAHARSFYVKYQPSTVLHAVKK